MSMIKEFKEFAMPGNIVDIAVGIIIGGAFGKIVSSAVTDIIMPPIGKLMGNVNFGDLFLNLDRSNGEFASLARAKDNGPAVIAYGAFMSTVIDFVIVAFCIFMMIRLMNSLKRKQETASATAPSTKNCEYCLSAVPIKAAHCPHCMSRVK
jgi:large conductance mechanosensitive channel